MIHLQRTFHQVLRRIEFFVITNLYETNTFNRRLNKLSYSGQSIGEIYYMAVLPSGCILKSPAGLSCCPHHEVGLLEVQTGAGMDEEAKREAAQGREDALAHSSVLPGHHPLVL